MLKGLIFDIKRFAVHDGPGIRTSVFLKGCPCSCRWCHNPESIKPYPQKISKTISLDGKTFKKEEFIGSSMCVFDVMSEIRKDKIFYDESGGGVTFSGGEPLMQSEFLLELLKECKNENIHTTVDTSGFVNEGKLLEIIDYVDLFLYDLKLINNELHKKYTGVSNKMILQNIQILVNRHKRDSQSDGGTIGPGDDETLPASRFSLNVKQTSMFGIDSRDNNGHIVVIAEC